MPLADGAQKAQDKCCASNEMSSVQHMRSSEDGESEMKTTGSGSHLTFFNVQEIEQRAHLGASVFAATR